MNAEPPPPNRRNLLLVAAYLDALPQRKFDQTRFQHPDGSPSCLVAHTLALLEPETWERAKRERSPRFAREQAARIFGLYYGQTADLYCGRPLGFRKSPKAKDAATMLKRIAWVRNAGINWPPDSPWGGSRSGYSRSYRSWSEMTKVAPKADYRAFMGAWRRETDLYLREFHCDSSERVTRTRAGELYGRLNSALANLDLNELYDTYRPRYRLDNYTQESIKRSAVSAAMRAILTDLNCWVVNEPPAFDDLAERIRRRVDAGGPKLDFHEAVETYRYAFVQTAADPQQLAALMATEERDQEIALSLWCLKGCGLPVLWRSTVRTEADDRRRDNRRPEDEPRVCLALAMATATGISQFRIAKAWKKFGHMY